MKYYLYTIGLILMLYSCTSRNDEHRVVVCIPVYGQSLALGEEAELITNFDSLSSMADGRIVTENMDHDFGFFDNDKRKEWAKKVLNYTKRTLNSLFMEWQSL